MIHSPVPDSIPNPSQTALSVPTFGGNLTTLHPSISPAMPPFLPFPTQEQITSYASRLLAGSTSLNLNGNGPSTGSSSLSSSLMSLHSSSPNGSAIPTPTSLMLSSSSQPSSSNTRYSRWLKLRVCPSFLSIPPPNSTSPSSATAADGSSVESFKGLQCSSSDTCPYAHPTENIRVEAGHVTVCYDFIKRKLCKHSSCKYYHPPPHQIEAVLKRGDEQRRMLDSQQRLADLRPTGYVSMHPQPSTLVNNGLSTLPSAAVTSCSNNNTTIPWNSPATLALLQQNQANSSTNPLIGAAYIPCLNPNAISALSIPFASPSSDPNSFQTTAVLAAAAVATMQPNNNLSSTSLVAAPMMTQTTNQQQQASHTDNNVSSTSHLPFSDSRLTATSTITSNGGPLGTTLLSPTAAAALAATVSHQHLIHPSASVTSASQTFDAVNTLLSTVNSSGGAAINDASLLQQKGLASEVASSSSTKLEPCSVNAVNIPYQSSTLPLSVAVRPGMKREASASIDAFSDGVVGSDLLHPWLPLKRSSRQWINHGDKQATTCNGDTQCASDDIQRNAQVASSSTSAVGSSSLGSSCTSSFPQGYVTVSDATTNPSMVPSSMSNLLNPLNLNLYGLPISTVTQPYLTPHITYPTMHSNQGNADGTQNTLAALTLNNLMTQQHNAQVQSQLVSPIPISVPSAAAQLSPSNLAVALAAIQQQQAPTQNLSASTPTVQAYLLSNLVRAHQSQQAQLAQMMAAVQATDGAGVGYFPAGASPRTNAFGSLPGNCLLDASYGLPLSGLGAYSYPTNFPATTQSLITNVAYINDRGHLLETLPICRDFKAGKCHRNGDCRYVHLVDENVEVNQGRVVVCRDAAKGRCTRVPCKYYHIPLFAISNNRSLALNSALTGNGLTGAHHSL